MLHSPARLRASAALNSSSKRQEEWNSLLFLFEKVISVNANSLCIDSQVKLRRRAERIICKSEYETWESVIEYWDSPKYPYRS